MSWRMLWLNESVHKLTKVNTVVEVVVEVGT